MAALTPKAEIEGEMGDSHVGLQARLMSQALRKLAGTLNRTDTICLFTNQLREKIGVMFGSPETTPGGRALKFYSSVRLDIRRIETLKDGAEAIGNRVRVKVVKNKVAPPFKQAEFDIIYGSGISWEGTVLDVGIERKIVHEVGLVLQLRGRAARPGAAERNGVPREHPDVVQADPRADPGGGGTGADRLRAAAAAGRGRGATEAMPAEDGGRRRGVERRRGGGRDGHGHRVARARRQGRGRARRRPVADAPDDAVADAGLAVGLALDRERARALARALRRQHALGVLVRALERRDRAAPSSTARSHAPGCGDTSGARRSSDGSQTRGLVDDSAFAATRARHAGRPRRR